MLQFVGRRVTLALPVLLSVVTVIFLVVRVLPGDPAQVALGDTASQAAIDAGPGMDAEFMWLNQAPAAPIAAYKKAWFRSTAFRRAISDAINREDITRIVYRGHAKPASGPVSPANHFWFNNALKPAPYRPEEALRSLQKRWRETRSSRSAARARPRSRRRATSRSTR